MSSRTTCSRPLCHPLPRFQQQLPLAVIRRHALRQQQPRLRDFVCHRPLLPQRGFQLVFVFAEHIGRPLPLQLQRFVSDIGAVIAQQPLFQIADEFGLLALVHAVAMQQCAAQPQADFHAALRIRQIRPRLRLPQPRLLRRQIGRAGKGGVNQAVELGIVERPPPLRGNRRLWLGEQAEGGSSFNRGERFALRRRTPRQAQGAAHAAKKSGNAS